MIAKTPNTPYYAVIFTSVRTEEDKGYSIMSNKMIELVQKLPGFLGFESAREKIGITVSYWSDLEAIKSWRENMEHTIARKKGRAIWYQQFTVRIAKVENEYSFNNLTD